MLGSRNPFDDEETQRLALAVVQIFVFTLAVMDLLASVYSP